MTAVEVLTSWPVLLVAVVPVSFLIGYHVLGPLWFGR